MAGNPRRADSGVFRGMSSCSLDLSLLKFVNHHGPQEVAKIISTLGDHRKDETRKAFAKMISDFNSKPLIVDGDLDEEDEDDDDEDEDEDKNVNDEADGKECKFFGDTKVAGLVKRLHAPIGDELEPKKPRIAESSCVHGDKTEAAEREEDSSLQETSQLATKTKLMAPPPVASMAGNACRADGGVFRGMSSCSLDLSLLKFVNHHGIQEVAKIISTLGDCRKDETRKAFAKMISDFNSKPLIVDGDLDEEDEDEDKAEGEEDEDEDEDKAEADGKECKPFGDTKVAGLVKRLHAPIGDELEPKKPRIAESSCVHGDKTEAAEIKDSSLQALMTG